MARVSRLLAVLLAEMSDRRLYVELGYASVFEYADRVLDLPARQARDLIRIGRHLPDLPALAAAPNSGQLGWTKAREVVSVATPETEDAWVARAVAVTSRVLQQQVVCARVGELPPAAAAQTARLPERRRVSFDMQAADLEVLRQALRLMRAQLGLVAAELDDGVLLAALAGHFLNQQPQLGDPPTGERYRWVIQDCPSCGDVHGPAEEVSDTVAAEAACDAEVIDMRPGLRQGRSIGVIAPLLRKKLLNRAQWRCEGPAVVASCGWTSTTCGHERTVEEMSQATSLSSVPGIIARCTPGDSHWNEASTIGWSSPIGTGSHGADRRASDPGRRPTAGRRRRDQPPFTTARSCRRPQV